LPPAKASSAAPVEPDRKIGNVNWKIRNAQDGNHGYCYDMCSINPCSQATARVQVMLKQSPELREKLFFRSYHSEILGALDLFPLYSKPTID
jgi:hypothetical protein